MMRTEDKRRRILAAATAVFAERDFHRVQVSEVATRAGVGKGTVYLYFPTKEQLHRVALDASLECTRAEMLQAAEMRAPVDQVLRAIVLPLLRFFWRRQHLLTLVQRHERRGHADGRMRALRAVEQVLVRNRLGGTPAARHLSAAFLLGLARAAILEHGPSHRPEAAADRVVEVYLNGLRGTARRARVRPVRRQRRIA